MVNLFFCLMLLKCPKQILHFANERNGALWIVICSNSNMVNSTCRYDETKVSLLNLTCVHSVVWYSLATYMFTYRISMDILYYRI